MVVTDGITSQYKHYCEQLGIKANSQVLQQLPTEAGAATFVNWDLSGNCVGTKGAIAVLKLVQNNFHSLQRLSFRGNNLASAVTQDIYNALVRHPSIRSVDLSGNDIRLGGPALVDLVKRNKNIVELNIDQTFLRPLFERLIALHLKRNQETSASSSSSSAVAAAAAPTAAAAARVDENTAATQQQQDEGAGFAIGRSRKRGIQMAAEEDDGNPAASSGNTEQKRSPRRTTFSENPEDDSAANSNNNNASDDGAGGVGTFVSGFGFGEEASDQDKNAFVINPDEEDNGEDNMHVSFKNALEGKKVIRRATVHSEALSADEIDNFVPTKNDHPPEVREFLFKALEKHELFSHLEDFELYVAVDAMEAYPRDADSYLYEEEDEELDEFFMIVKGRLEISRGGNVVEIKGPGDSVLDTMLMYSGNATETAKVLEDDSQFYKLDRKTYRCVLTQASKKKRAMYEGFLSEIKFLQGLTKEELLSLADSLKPAQYKQGEKLITYGSRGEHFFIIVEGEVDVIGRNDEGNERYVCSFGVGACVGELEFIHEHECVADVKAKTDDCRVAKMNRRHFEMVMGPVKDVLARTAAESEVYEYYRGTQAKRKEKQAAAAAENQ